MILPDDFFASGGELRKEAHPLPDGKIVWVEEISAQEWAEIRVESAQYRLNVFKADLLFDARFVVRAVTDGAGKTLFPRPADLTDPKELKAYNATLAKIMAMPARVISPLMARVNRLNSEGEAETEAAKKNSETSDGSSSSPETPATSISA